MTPLSVQRVMVCEDREQEGGGVMLVNEQDSALLLVGSGGPPVQLGWKRGLVVILRMFRFIRTPLERK